VRLAERLPQVDLETLVAGFRPPPRFGEAKFGSYRPNVAYASQASALQKIQAWLRPGFKRTSKGLYLDGGFGVGKTHLLVAAFLEAKGPKAYLSFEELTYTVGLVGMPKAVERFSRLKYLFIDEFELDDPGNAQMVTNLLGQTMRKGLRVMTTSNTQPEALGQGRFNADQFRIQIQSLASQFADHSIDGPDYRHRDFTHSPKPLDPEVLQATFNQNPKATLDTWPSVLELLRRLHPVRYRYLLEGLEAVYIQDLAAISDPNDALRLVHFIDKVYDSNVSLKFSGVPLANLFGEYRQGAFAKKFGRCLSRLAELIN
jgi:cell division protein ZapE